MVPDQKRHGGGREHRSRVAFMFFMPFMVEEKECEPGVRRTADGVAGAVRGAERTGRQRAEIAHHEEHEEHEGRSARSGSGSGETRRHEGTQARRAPKIGAFASWRLGARMDWGSWDRWIPACAGFTCRAEL